MDHNGLSARNFTIYKTTSYLGNVVANRYLAQINYTDIVLNDRTLKEKISTSHPFTK